MHQGKFPYMKTREETYTSSFDTETHRHYTRHTNMDQRKTRLELIKADWKGLDIQGRLTATRHISFSSIICSLIIFLFQATWVKEPHFKKAITVQGTNVQLLTWTYFQYPAIAFVNNAINPKAFIALSNYFDYLVNTG